MADPFPHSYEVSLDGADAEQLKISAGQRPVIVGGLPQQFGGGDAKWSPEHLLLASASLCMMLSFKAIAAKSSLEFSGYRCRAEGTLDKTPAGISFTEIILHVNVSSNDIEKATRLLELAKKYCIVSNSLKHPISLKLSISKI